MGIFSGIKAIFTGKKTLKPKAVSDFNGVSSTRFYGQKFEGGLPQPTPTLLLDSEHIRQQVRTLSHNSLQLRGLIERDGDTVIAQGLNISPEPKHQILGITPEAAEQWSNDVKQRFDLWAMFQRSNRSGRYNFYQAQRLMYKCLRRDGEAFIALSYHNDPLLLSPLRFEMIDPDQIREMGFTWTATGSMFGIDNKQGIIRNADGEETAYKVWTRNNAGIPQETQLPAIGRGGRKMMLHASTGTDYAGQLRGISPFAVCVQDLEHILNFTLAQVNKAINQSNVAFTVESETDEPAAKPFIKLPSTDTLLAFGNGPGAAQYGNDPQPEAGAQNVTEESIKPVYTGIQGNFNKPGQYGVFTLPGKQKLKPFPDTSPAAAFNVFVDSYFAYIAAATGQSVETVLMRFNNNYSASRATLILTWRIAEQRRWEMDYYILGPVYEMWLSEEIAAGRVSAPGWADPRLKAAWAAHRFNGLRMPNIDPVQTMKSAKMAVEMGASTMSEGAQEYNDSDFEANCVKLNEEYKNLPKPLWGWGGKGAEEKTGSEKSVGGKAKTKTKKKKRIKPGRGEE